MDFLASIEIGLAEKLKNRTYRTEYFALEASARIARQLIELRKRRNLSQSDLAQLIGTKQSGVSRVESADYGNWNFNTLRKIAESLDARLRVLIEPAEDVLVEYSPAGQTGALDVVTTSFTINAQSARRDTKPSTILGAFGAEADETKILGNQQSHILTDANERQGTSISTRYTEVRDQSL